MTARAHLVGSVNLSTGVEVLRAVGERVGDLAARIPDGETGERAGWNQYQLRVLRPQQALEVVASAHVADLKLPRFRLRPGKTADDLDLETLGYADEAASSYAAFTE